MITREAQGYSKEKALEATGLDVELSDLRNATLKWKQKGSPLNTKELNVFMAEYIKTNKIIGAYIVVDGSSDDTRLRPYTMINEITNGKRKTKTVYQVKEADFSVKFDKETKVVVDKETGEEKVVEGLTPYKKETVKVVTEVTDPETGEKTSTESWKEIEVAQVKVHSVGAVEDRADKKETAFKIAKELTAINKKNYVVEIVKEVVGGQKFAGYCMYMPSKSAKMGKFMFFVRE